MIAAHWNFIGTTPAYGKEFKHKRRSVIIIVYHNTVRLFLFSNKVGYPCHADIKLQRDKNGKTYQFD